MIIIVAITYEKTGYHLNFIQSNNSAVAFGIFEYLWKMIEFLSPSEPKSLKSTK